MNKCPACGSPTEARWKFCPSCGHPTTAMTAVCGVCGNLITMDLTAASVHVFFHDPMNRERRVCFLLHDACVDKLDNVLIQEHGREIVSLTGTLTGGLAS